MRFQLQGDSDLAKWASGRARELVTARAANQDQFLTTTLEEVVDEVLQPDDQALERLVYLVAALSLVGASAIWTVGELATQIQPALTREEARANVLEGVMTIMAQIVERGGPAI
jgi:hypothetical protein